MSWSDGARFKGQFNYGRLENGTYIFPDGSEYIGGFSLDTCDLEG